MRWHPRGYGGRRRDPEQVKREGWREQGVLAVSADDDRLTWPEPSSFSVDHFPIPLSVRPDLAEDPANLAAAHLRCNQSAGNRHPDAGLGATSTAW